MDVGRTLLLTQFRDAAHNTSPFSFARLLKTFSHYW